MRVYGWNDTLALNTACAAEFLDLVLERELPFYIFEIPKVKQLSLTLSGESSLGRIAVSFPGSATLLKSKHVKLRG